MTCEDEARELLNGHGNWRVDREQMIAKVAAALRERGEKIEVLRRDAMFFDMARVEALEERDQLRKELEKRNAQVEALQREADFYREKITSLTNTNESLLEQRDAARAQVQRLREALDALQDHHCGGMCERNHEKVMAQVNAAMAATEEA